MLRIAALMFFYVHSVETKNLNLVLTQFK